MIILVRLGGACAERRHRPRPHVLSSTHSPRGCQPRRERHRPHAVSLIIFPPSVVHVGPWGTRVVRVRKAPVHALAPVRVAVGVRLRALSLVMTWVPRDHRLGLLPVPILPFIHHHPTHRAQSTQFLSHLRRRSSSSSRVSSSASASPARRAGRVVSAVSVVVVTAFSPTDPSSSSSMRIDRDPSRAMSLTSSSTVRRRRRRDSRW